MFWKNLENANKAADHRENPRGNIPAGIFHFFNSGKTFFIKVEKG